MPLAMEPRSRALYRHVDHWTRPTCAHHEPLLILGCAVGRDVRDQPTTSPPGMIR